MKYSFLVSFLSFLVPALIGAELSVANDPLWKPASEQQVAALASQPGVTVIDFSLKPPEGAGYLLRSEFPSEVHPEVVESVVTGYLQSITSQGHSEIVRSSCKIGPLPGVCIVSKRLIGNSATGAVSFFLFSRKQMYTATVFGAAGTTNMSPITVAYLDRIKIPSDIEPGSIDKDSAFEMGRRTGLFIGKWIVWIVALSALACVGFVYSRRKQVL